MKSLVLSDLTPVNLTSIHDTVFNKIANQDGSDVLNFSLILILENLWFDEQLPMMEDAPWKSV